MANKKLLGTAASDLKLPAKKAKGEKKPKWQAQTGGKKGKAEPVVETSDSVVEPTPEVEQALEVAATEPSPAPEGNPELPETPPAKTVSTEEPSPKKAHKLKVKADLKSKKLSMIKAALQVINAGVKVQRVPA